MIMIDKRKFTVDGIDVYPDHDPREPYQFWYVPGNVKLAERDKKKVLSYLWYSDSATDADGTGFLNFEVNTAVTASQKDQIRAEIAARTGLERSKINLAAVTYQSGQVNFSVLGPMAQEASSSLKEGDVSVIYKSQEQIVWTAGSSSLVGDNAAVCSVKLTKTGKLAAALKAAIQHGANTIAAVYRLEFLAMRPSISLKVTGTFKNTIRDFQLSAGMNMEEFLLDVGIQAQWERIMKNTDLKIEVINFTGEVEEGLTWAKQLLLDYVLKNFFEVQIGGTDRWSPLSEEPKAAEAVAKTAAVEESAMEKADEEGKQGEEKDKAVKEQVKGAGIPIPSIKIRAAYYDGKQVNSIDFLYTEMKAKTYIVAPQALVMEGLGDTKRYITEVLRAQMPFGLAYPVVVSLPEEADRKKIGIQSINVQARYPAGAKQESQSAFNLTVLGNVVTGTNPFQFQYDSSGSPEMEYSIEYVFKPSDEWQADQLTYLTRGRADRGMLTAMPEAILEFLKIDIRLASDFIWDEADQAVVALTSKRWTGEKKVVLQKGAATSQTFCVRSDSKLKNDPIHYRIEGRKNNKVLFSHKPETVLNKQIIVTDRFGGHIPLIFRAAFPAGVESAEIYYTYEDGDFLWTDEFTLEAKKTVQRIVPTLKAMKAAELKVDVEITPDGKPTFIKTAQGGRTLQVKGE